MAGHHGGGTGSPVVRAAAAPRQFAGGGAPGPVLHVAVEEAGLADGRSRGRAAQPGGF